MARAPKITPRMLSNARRQASRTTAKNIESKTGPIQKAGRAVDNFGKTVAGNYRDVGKDISSAASATKSAYTAASKKVGKVATRYGQGDFRPESKLIKSGAKAAVKGEGNVMAKAGKWMTDGLATKKSTQKAVGRSAVYGSSAAIGGAYAAGRGAFSSWSEHKKQQSNGGGSKPTPYGQ